MMETGKSLLVRIEQSKSDEVDDSAGTLGREISLDYSDDDIEMLSDSEEHPKRKKRQNPEINFAPVDDIDVFAVGDDYVDTTDGEIRREAKVKMVFNVEKLGGPPNTRRYENPRLKQSGEFDSFINSTEQRKAKVERAKRFGLDSVADESSSAEPEEPLIDEPTEVILDKLYGFYDIDPQSVRHQEKYRLNAIYLRGVSHLSTENIFDYFGHYNPTYLEWIDDNSCNVVWKERNEAARGLLGTSRPLRRIFPQKSQGDGNTGKEEDVEREEFTSILKRRLSLDERDEESKVVGGDQSPARDEDLIMDGDIALDVDISRFTVPPGQWRVGKKDHESHAILMRFSTIHDSKTPGAQIKSRYYQEHGNPNFGGQIGLISRSYMDRATRKRRRGSEDAAPPKEDLRKSITDRERWNLLHDDIRRDPELEPGELVEEEDLATGQVELKYFSSDDEDIEDEREAKQPRMRMRADEEEDRKVRKRRRLERVKSRSSNNSGIDGDWRGAQRSHYGNDLRDRLHDSRIKVTVTNDRTSSQDLRHRLGRRRKLSDWDEEYNKGEEK